MSRRTLRLLKIKHEPYTIDVEITNNGEEPLQGCFISPIRFGKNYLGCLKSTIVDECNKAEKTIIKVLITFEDGNDEIEDNYYGYYRLKTNNGDLIGLEMNVDTLDDCLCVLYDYLAPLRMIVLLTCLYLINLLMLHLHTQT